jgi:hypothetical protein
MTRNLLEPVASRGMVRLKESAENSNQDDLDGLGHLGLRRYIRLRRPQTRPERGLLDALPAGLLFFGVEVQSRRRFPKVKRLVFV